MFRGWNNTFVFIVFLCLPIISLSHGGETAADFLRIGVGTRAIGMGEAGTASSRGAEAAYWNPAGLAPTTQRIEMISGHFFWFQDVSVDHCIVAFRLNRRTSMAASIVFVDYGDIKGYDSYGMATGEQLTAYDLSGTMSIGLVLYKNLSTGISAKIINQYLDGINAYTFAFDFGMRLRMGNTALSGALVNFGPDIRFAKCMEKLPITLRLGAFLFFPTKSIITALDIDLPKRGDVTVNTGIEYNENDQYFLRGGIQINPRDFKPHPTFGCGMRIENFVLNYAYTTGYHYMRDALHRFSLTVNIP